MATLQSEHDRLRTYIKKHFPGAYNDDAKTVDLALEVMESFAFIRNNTTAIKEAIIDRDRMDFLELNKPIIKVADKVLGSMSVRDAIDGVIVKIAAEQLKGKK